ncbi:hypothetical protein [Spirulina sp. 06S082]|nr:hypothetical protein [Spirulina sp. 06S082]MEA5469809.1 hypothetical protein [Spirulina sp. 06S082]
MNKKKPFIGLNRYEIGWPPVGYAYLYLDFEMLENMTPQEALEKVEAIGYQPSLRFLEKTTGLATCALLKVVKMEDETCPDSPFEDIIEALFETFGNAVRSPSGRPRAYYTQQGIDPDYQDAQLREPQLVGSV